MTWSFIVSHNFPFNNVNKPGLWEYLAIYEWCITQSRSQVLIKVKSANGLTTRASRLMSILNMLGVGWDHTNTNPVSQVWNRGMRSVLCLESR